MNHNSVKLAICLVVVIFLSSCTRNPARIVYTDTSCTVYSSLKSSGRMYDIISVDRLLVYDSLLIAKKNSDSTLISIINLRDGSIVDCILRGRGPGEGLQVTDIFVEESSGKLFLLEAQNKYLMGYPIVDLLDGSFKARDTEIIPLYDDQFTYRAVDTGDGFLCHGRFNEYRLVRVTRGESVTGVAAYSPDTEGGKIDKFINEAFYGWLDYSKERHSAVLACMNGNQIEVYDTETGEVYIIKDSEHPVEPSYEIVADYGGTLVLTENYYGYRDLKIHDGLIYGLYYGEMVKADMPEHAYLRVFDWDGTLRYEYTIDGYVDSFAIAGNEIYLATNEGIIVNNIMI